MSTNIYIEKIKIGMLDRIKYIIYCLIQLQKSKFQHDIKIYLNYCSWISRITRYQVVP